MPRVFRRRARSSSGRAVSNSHEMWITLHPSAESASALDVTLPGVRAEVVFLSVALDRNLQVRIGKVHSGNEGALVVEDLVLPFRGRKEMGIKEVQQFSFERAPRHG